MERPQGSRRGGEGEGPFLLNQVKELIAKANELMRTRIESTLDKSIADLSTNPDIVPGLLRDPDHNVRRACVAYLGCHHINGCRYLDMCYKWDRRDQPGIERRRQYLVSPRYFNECP
jgi:hypothetical protein